MKAYEIKVTIKGSKPPIWRKIIIPAGINFNQLHNVIQVAFEWLNYHLYEFSFNDFPEKITNDRETADEYQFYKSPQGKRALKEMGLPITPLPEVVLYAEDIIIDKYLNESKKFTYIYDFGDWWEHKIEVLSIIDDYKFDYPMVTKFKQASPPDDCGGIDGYYEFLEHINNEDDPMHDEMVAWGRGQFYNADYDIDNINDQLEEVLDYSDDDFDFFDE